MVISHLTMKDVMNIITSVRYSVNQSRYNYLIASNSSNVDSDMLNVYKNEYYMWKELYDNLTGLSNKDV